MKHKINVADFVTLSRIVFAVLVLFCPAFSVRFYLIYLLGSFTDMIDGRIARKLSLKSPFGAKLDTIADYAFVIAVLVKVFPVLCVPEWLWIWIAGIAFIKLANLVSSLVLFRRIVPIHTIMNKATGFMLFLLPFGIGIERLSEIAVIVTCFAATLAALQEGYFIRIGKDIE